MPQFCSLLVLHPPTAENGCVYQLVSSAWCSFSLYFFLMLPHAAPHQNRPLCQSRSPRRQASERTHIPRTTLQTCCVCHRKCWRRSQETTTFLKLLTQADHPSPVAKLWITNALFNRWPAKFTVCLRNRHHRGRKPTSHRRCAPYRAMRVPNSGLDLALCTCTSGAAGM